jgi:F-type H+-transporting ATPase subunit epsilon
MEIHAKVVSQTKRIYEGSALSLSLPTIEGVITLYPEHMNLVSLLSMGTIHISGPKLDTDILISGGLVQVSGQNVTILSDEAVLSKDITQKEINEAIDNAKNKIAGTIDPTELIQLEKQLKFELFKKRFVEKL